MDQNLSRLNTLPIDMLQSVVGHLSGHHIGKLWLSGDIRMQSQLQAQNVVKSIEIQYHHLLHFEWPSLISHFHYLEELRLFHTIEVDPVIMKHTQLQKLPPKLLRLRLDFPSSALVLWRRQSPIRPQYSIAHIKELLPNLEELRLDPTGLPDIESLIFQTINALPLNLRSLDLGKGTEIDPNIIYLLPSTLTSLSACFSRLPSSQNEQTWEPQYPVGLTSLQLHQLRNTCLFSRAPVGLLRLYIDFGSLTSLSNVPSFPPNLTDLTIITNFYAWPQLTNLFPASLTRLDYTGYCRVPMEQLSQQCPHLQVVLWNAMISTTALGHILECVPPTITDFVLTHKGRSVTYPRESVQKTHKSFRNLGNLQISPESPLPALPPLIRRLCFTSPIIDSQAVALPKHLVALEAPLWRLTRKGLQSIQQLPLRELQANHGTRRDTMRYNVTEMLALGHEITEESGARIGFLEFLPHTITDLLIELPEHPYWQLDISNSRFPFLQNLSICDAGDFVSPPSLIDFTSPLPAVLQKLLLPNLSLGSSSLKLLPRALDSLRLKGLNPPFSNPSLALLPRNLTSLWDDSHEPCMVTTLGLCHLPRTLTKLILPPTPRIVDEDHFSLTSASWKPNPLKVPNLESFGLENVTEESSEQDKQNLIGLTSPPFLQHGSPAPWYSQILELRKIVLSVQMASIEWLRTELEPT